MLTVDQMIYLVTFYEEKTLTKAAQKLHLSQPVLSRAMQAIEQTLEVQLFTRTKNKIEFNENGRYVVKQVQAILTQIQQLKPMVLAHQAVNVGTCAPAPLLEVKDRLPTTTIHSSLLPLESLIQGLEEHQLSLIIMPYPSTHPSIASFPFMEEQLFFSLPPKHPLATHPSLPFEALDGERMLLMEGIGFWHDIHHTFMPHTKFLIQKDRGEFYDLVDYSYLPSFTSDYMMNREGRRPHRHTIPITNPEAHATFYLWYLKEDKERLGSLLKAFHE